MRKRKVTYPPPRNKKQPPPAVASEPTYIRPTVVSINLNAEDFEGGEVRRAQGHASVTAQR